ncbi:helix-turn-helix transcriptional regulator [Dactylosporangium sp. NPDC051485]|uniref:helix-turn-helix transcriptional regulator n=1 Tax=Dactylosporangium sp. NPDC051485 TaxID=3154846 RepID=UPI00342CA084
MRAALNEWDWSKVLTLVVAATGISQLDLANLTGFSQPHVSRLMNGTAKCFDIRAINRMIDGLGAPRIFAGLAPALAEDGVTVAVSPQLEVSPMRRRALLATSFALPIAAVLGTEERPRVVTHGHARKIRSLLPDLYALDDQVGGAPVSDVTQWCLGEVDALLQTAEYSEAAGQELQLAYGELAEMAGWLDFDTGQISSAQYHFGEALRTAQIAGDLNLEVLVLASMIMLARHRGRPREAIQLSQLAQRRARGWGSPRLLSLLTAREATAWAQAGDTGAARTAMTRALHTFEPARSDEDPVWLSFYTTAELTAQQASVSSYLNQPAQAATKLRSAVHALEPQYTRNHALYSARLALAHLADGDDRQACVALAPVLPAYTNVRSGRAIAHLGECLAGLQQSPVPEAKDLIEQATALGLMKAA